MTTTRFEFEFEDRVRPAAAAFGAVSRRTWVEVGDGELRIRFGFFRLTTPLANITGATVTGPYSWLRIAGPPRLSLADRGITFATTTRGGVCIQFAEPVAMRPPYGPLRHPGATVTVTRAEELAALLNGVS